MPAPVFPCRILSGFEEMTICGRPLIGLFLACVIVSLAPHPVRASYDSEAGRAYAVASRRLADLKKSPDKNKYRSNWIDRVRAFEQVEKKYGKSRYARDACFDRAETYRYLHQRSTLAKDIDESLKIYAQCAAFYPGHSRAPEALYRIIEISLDHKKDVARAAEVYSRLSKSHLRSNWTSKAKDRMKKTSVRVGKRRQALNAARRKRIPRGVVSTIRYRSSGEYTRVVIDYQKNAEFRVTELKDPPRLVFDLLNAQLGPSVDNDPLEVNDGILRQIRASQYAPDTVRVVLDLASIKSYAAFPLRDPQRLVIDVMGDAHKGFDPVLADGTSPLEPGAASGRRTAAGSLALPQAGTGHAVKAPDAGNGGFSLSRQLGLKVRTIAIDAGHGGRDPGAVGRRGTKEKNITLDIAKRLAVLVKKGLECNVVMTRDRDAFIPLEDRPAIARTNGADLFVSIHVNATRRRGAKGIETYIQGLRASDREAMETAARENSTTARTLGELDDELTKILTGLRMVSNDDDSIRLAHAVQGSLVNTVKPIQGTVADLGVKRAFFYVLINTGMPSILAEVGFISNLAEESLLNKKSYRQAIAEALYEGLKTYVDSRVADRKI
jgi:N-acetylmuramoyl-L-alanine amidase